MSEVHAQARTTPRTRAEIKESSASLAELAERYNISRATARKWRGRETAQDLSHRPHQLTAQHHADTRTGGWRVRSHARAESRHVLIDLQDSAPGVADANLARIFDRFFQVEGSRNRASGGAGLGLAICSRIVRSARRQHRWPRVAAGRAVDCHPSAACRTLNHFRTLNGHACRPTPHRRSSLCTHPRGRG